MTIQQQRILAVSRNRRLATPWTVRKEILWTGAPKITPVITAGRNRGFTYLSNFHPTSSTPKTLCNLDWPFQCSHATDTYSTVHSWTVTNLFFLNSTVVGSTVASKIEPSLNPWQQRRSPSPFTHFRASTYQHDVTQQFAVYPITRDDGYKTSSEHCITSFHTILKFPIIWNLSQSFTNRTTQAECNWKWNSKKSKFYTGSKTHINLFCSMVT